MTPCIVINLPSSTARREAISASLHKAGVQFSILEATCAPSGLSPRPSLFDRPLTPGEIGCAQSHLRAIEAIANGPDEFVCVLEDDAEIMPSLTLALDEKALASIPKFDVLRLVSDPARWRFPAWKVGTVNGLSVYATGRPGFGTQAQIWTREGAARVVAHIKDIQAPADFMLYHDCHVPGLRVLELRPGAVEHDRQFEDAAYTEASDIGARPSNPPRTFARRMSKRYRKLMAARSFLSAWGVQGLLRLIMSGMPWQYFR